MLLVVPLLSFQLNAAPIPKPTKPITSVPPNVIGTFLTLPKQPTFPDMRANAAKDQKIISDCINSGGTPDGLDCDYPPPPAPVVYETAPTYTQPADVYKADVYNYESGNDPTKWNGTGCFGLGQNCPPISGTTPAVLLACPTMAYACEDAWFTNYMLTHIDTLTGVPYGTWAEAWRHEQICGWW